MRRNVLDRPIGAASAGAAALFMFGAAAYGQLPETPVGPTTIEPIPQTSVETDWFDLNPQAELRVQGLDPENLDEDRLFDENLDQFNPRLQEEDVNWDRVRHGTNIRAAGPEREQLYREEPEPAPRVDRNRDQAPGGAEETTAPDSPERAPEAREEFGEKIPMFTNKPEEAKDVIDSERQKERHVIVTPREVGVETEESRQTEQARQTENVQQDVPQAAQTQASAQREQPAQPGQARVQPAPRDAVAAQDQSNVAATQPGQLQAGAVPRAMPDDGVRRIPAPGPGNIYLDSDDADGGGLAVVGGNIYTGSGAVVGGRYYTDDWADANSAFWNWYNN